VVELSWTRPRREDREVIKRFECAAPLDKWRPGSPREWRRRHPAWWEYEVQANVRELPIPPGVGEVILLGWIGGELVAVSWFEETDGPAQVDLLFMAVDLKHQGSGISRQMCERTLQEVESLAIAAGVAETLLTGYIHARNERSQAMARSMGFIDTTDKLEDDEVRRFQFPQVHPVEPLGER
jgi:GNAT superfamily N-acetyltransferase